MNRSTPYKRAWAARQKSGGLCGECPNKKALIQVVQDGIIVHIKNHSLCWDCWQRRKELRPKTASYQEQVGIRKKLDRSKDSFSKITTRAHTIGQTTNEHLSKVQAGLIELESITAIKELNDV